MTLETIQHPKRTNKTPLDGVRGRVLVVQQVIGYLVVMVDDGVRLWVNRHLLIDKWFDQTPTSYSADIYLPSGNIPILYEYYEHEGGARARLAWERIDAPTTEDGWRGEYYNNDRLAGSPVLVRLDPDIRFNWGTGSPGYSVNHDYFSVRWTRTIYFESGRYRFTTETEWYLSLPPAGYRSSDQGKLAKCCIRQVVQLSFLPSIRTSMQVPVGRSLAKGVDEFR